MSLNAFFSLGGVVMLPLLVLSILAIALILERLTFWRRVTQRQNRLMREVLYLYQQNPPEAFLKLEQNSDLPIARIFLAALELKRPTPEQFRLALESAVQAELPILKRFNTVFETVISVSPLLGLLGTILGLIDAFAALRIGDIGGQTTVGVTGGISEAKAMGNETKSIAESQAREIRSALEAQTREVNARLAALKQDLDSTVAALRAEMALLKRATTNPLSR